MMTSLVKGFTPRLIILHASYELDNLTQPVGIELSRKAGTRMNGCCLRQGILWGVST